LAAAERFAAGDMAALAFGFAVASLRTASLRSASSVNGIVGERHRW
jgi:hypothetical protein